MNDQIRKRVAGIIVNELGTCTENEIPIGNDTPLMELGIGVDSVSTLELVMALEKEFDLDIDESEINPDILYSLNTLSEFIERLKET